MEFGVNAWKKLTTQIEKKKSANAWNEQALMLGNIPLTSNYTDKTPTEEKTKFRA